MKRSLFNASFLSGLIASIMGNAAAVPSLLGPGDPRQSPGQHRSQAKLRKLCRGRGITVRQYKGKA